MEKVGLLVRVVAKPGKEKDVENFLWLFRSDHASDFGQMMPL
jgi:hypothetical protein